VNEAALRDTLRRDFTMYADRCLKIRTKSRGIRPFKLNGAQLRFHEACERQRQRTGKVRQLVLKARQTGISTYTEGRFYHRVTHSFGVKAYIMTHRQEATDNLFEMTERFHDNCPGPVRPTTGAANAKELSFQFLQSSFEVNTAGAKGAGRSATIQFLHGSEVAFWEKADAHVDGLLQAVPDAPDTEIIFESTANGPGGIFYNMCMAALNGEGDFELFFIPWFEHGEYRHAPEEGWEPPAAFREYGAAHGLTADQLHWCWRKNAELAIPTGDSLEEICPKFRQEYPATVQEAFQTTNEDVLIKPHVVLKARKTEVRVLPEVPLVAGLDVARGGGDKTRLVSRQGRRGAEIDETLDVRDLMQVTNWAQHWMAKAQLDWLFIDVTGLGAGVGDRMLELGHSNVTLVNFGERADEFDKYANVRAEIWGRMNLWLTDPAGVQLPDSEMVSQHLCAPTYRYDHASRLLLEKKEDMKKRIGFSPDFGDALALTFTHTVEPKADFMIDANERYSVETYDDPEF